jgi:tyrosyl-tRNA synthetase
MLLQALDFLELHKRLGVTLQVGGSDQWGNLTAGVELVRRSAGADVHALTAPLITTAKGRKFGKTEAGAVWLDPALTSPYRFYQFWINVDDADVGRYLRMFTLLPREEIVPMEKAHAAAPHERGAQRALARGVTAMLHGAEAARVAEECSRIVFDRTADVGQIGDDVFTVLSREIPSVRLARGDELDVLAVLEGAFGVSRSAGRKLIQQGGVTVNGAKLAAGDFTVARERAARGRWLLVRKGARDVAVAELA